MSERMAAEMWIGGKIPASLVPDLCKEISEQRVGLEWGEHGFQPHNAEDLLAACKKNDQDANVLWLCDDEARWGRFEELEQFLCKHGISFSRRSDGRYEYDPERIEYRPETGCFRMLTSAAGEPVVVAEPLRKVIDSLEQAASAMVTDSRDQAVAMIRQARRETAEAFPPSVPALEPLEIL